MNYMRQLIKLLLAISIIYVTTVSVHAAVEGRLEYHIPLDYTKLSQEELDAKAGFYYNLATKNYSGKLNDDMTTALNLYMMLHRKNPQNTFYSTRLGTLYDLLGQDKYARGCFEMALGVDSSKPEPYFRLGEFYYKRMLYKKALKNYKEAYKHGYTEHYETLYKLGDIYAKLGDTEAAIKYLRLAAQKNPNAELDNKLQRINAANATNREYYSDTRIRLIEK